VAVSVCTVVLGVERIRWDQGGHLCCHGRYALRISGFRGRCERHCCRLIAMTHRRYDGGLLSRIAQRVSEPQVMTLWHLRRSQQKHALRYLGTKPSSMFKGVSFFSSLGTWEGTAGFPLERARCRSRRGEFPGRICTEDPSSVQSVYRGSSSVQTSSQFLPRPKPGRSPAALRLPEQLLGLTT
jgi:hypothetical protein